MSKNITIKEGGTAKQLTVDKLKTNLVSGGTCLWVPEDEAQLTTKTITENGTYKASDDGYYGYSQVTVSGIGTVTGTDPETGDEVVVTTDPDTGEIVEDTVPSSIRVVTPPYNPYGIYNDGQTIDISAQSGFEVVALLADGNVYEAEGYVLGHIPNSELSIDPTTATYDPSTVTSGGTATIDDTTGLSQDTIDAMPIPYGTEIIGTTGTYETGMAPSMGDAITSLSNTEPVYSIALLDTNGNITPYLCSKAAFNGVRATHNPGGEGTYTQSFSSTGTMVNGNPIHYAQVLSTSRWTLQTPDATEAMYIIEAAYVVCYGVRSGGQTGSRQEITVSWPRPHDGKVLTTTFEILVAPPYSSGEES